MEYKKSNQKNKSLKNKSKDRENVVITFYPYSIEA